MSKKKKRAFTRMFTLTESLLVSSQRLSRMELSRSIDEATNKVSNSPAQMHASCPVLPYSNTALSSPLPIRRGGPPIDHHQRMWFIMQHPAMTPDRLDVT